MLPNGGLALVPFGARSMARTKASLSYGNSAHVFAHGIPGRWCQSSYSVREEVGPWAIASPAPLWPELICPGARPALNAEAAGPTTALNDNLAKGGAVCCQNQSHPVNHLRLGGSALVSGFGRVGA